MSSTLAQFSAIMRDIGRLLAPHALAAGAETPTAPQRVNAHIHLPPNFSAFETTRQALELAAAQDIRVLGASNYYDYAVYADFAALARQHGIFPLFGLEIIVLIEALAQAGLKINDPGNPGKMYICGKGITAFDPMSETAQGLLQVIRDNDSARMAAMTDRLAEVFRQAGLETGLDAESIKARVVARHDCPPASVYLQERHLAQAFQETLFDQVPERDRVSLLERLFGAKSKAQPNDAVAVQNEIRAYLMKAGKPAYAEETFVDFDHAYRLILALGGIPCYPTLADGGAAICDFEQSVERLIADLKARGVVCAEFIPIRNTPEVLSRYVHAMRDAGFFVTAGTEHNTLDLIPMEPTCVNGAPIPDDLKAIFREGACVLAAHQYLTLNGQPGFVNAAGKLHPGYATDEARIEAFRALGASVIAQYQSLCATPSV